MCEKKTDFSVGLWNRIYATFGIGSVNRGIGLGEFPSSDDGYEYKSNPSKLSVESSRKSAIETICVGFQIESWTIEGL